MSRWRVAAVVCLVAILQIVLAPTCYANAGPPLRVEDGDTAFLIPSKNDSIEVISEDLVYDIKAPEGEKAYAEINATYRMVNTSPETVSTLVAFVASNPDEPISVILDGSPITVQSSTTVPWNVSGEEASVDDLLKRQWSNVGLWTDFGLWEPTFEEILRVASTGQRTDDLNAGYDLALSVFEITLSPGVTHTLEVSYVETAAVIAERSRFNYGYGDPRAEFYYFLEPAQYWKDFSNLAVTLRLPCGMSFETSLGDFAREGDSYVARFEKLPAKNLRILVNLSASPPKGNPCSWLVRGWCAGCADQGACRKESMLSLILGA